ncbi:MAG: DUF1993 domain-containing protein [Labilithrix sp.]|nr:DUF1993 domain-containing protein [Labilithrix sp.]MBX3223484.1 DUF1993 domain-containing protein [Labilithrix sp.]
MTSLYDLTVPHFDKSLRNLERWIDKAHDHATAKKFDANTLLAARLAPDQYPLVRQIQSICDNAKFVCGRATGKAFPSHPDTEKTWDELRARIASVRAYLEGFAPADFTGAEERDVALPFMPGKVLSGKAYVLEFGLPNFDFHLVTAYSILRHNGVELGKLVFIGGLPFRDAG